MSFRLPRVYPLTDAGLTGLPHSEQVRRLSDAGASLVQLREKTMSGKDFYAEAKAALVVARENGVKLVINDRIDIVLAIGADGVHLGQDDLPPWAARALLGPHAIIGFSSHNVVQAVEAVSFPIDYLAVGPIFGTSTKADTAPELGLEGLREIRKRVPDIPLVAIGGISQANASEVINAGADCVAVISCLLSDPTLITQRTSTLIGSL